MNCKLILSFFPFFLISRYEYARVFSNNQEFASYRSCSIVRGDLVVAPFGQSNNITTEIRIQSMESYMMATFVVLKGGLDSG